MLKNIQYTASILDMLSETTLYKAVFSQNKCCMLMTYVHTFSSVCSAQRHYKVCACGQLD